MKMVKGLTKPCELSETQVCFAESNVLTKYILPDYSPAVESGRVAGGRSKEGTTALCWPDMKTQCHPCGAALKSVHVDSFDVVNGFSGHIYEDF